LPGLFSAIGATLRECSATQSLLNVTQMVDLAARRADVFAVAALHRFGLNILVAALG
jgi:hypothetical protein